MPNRFIFGYLVYFAVRLTAISGYCGSNYSTVRFGRSAATASLKP